MPALATAKNTLPTAQKRRWRNAGWMDATAITLWAVTFAVIFIRIALTSRHNIYATYEAAGKDWLAGRNLYTTTHGRGFVYSPLAAVFFAGLSLLPDLLSNILWRLLNAAVYLGGVWTWLKVGINGDISRKGFPVVFLLLLPLSLGNLNTGQANPLVVGLLMLGILGAKSERWYVAAFCVACAAYLKIYPLAAGLLLAVVFPRKCAGRLLIALVILGVLPFLFQKPSYVLAQYQSWSVTRATDDRHIYEPGIAPHDLLLVLRAVRLSINERAYAAVQFLAGLGIALVCFFGRLRRWPQNRLLAALFTLVCCWMVLLGPATESPTYILLAPATVLALVQGFEEPRPKWMRGLAVASLAFLLLGFGVNSFILNKDPYQILQPIGAILFSCYAVIWLLTPSFWPDETPLILPHRLDDAKQVAEPVGQLADPRP